MLTDFHTQRSFECTIIRDGSRIKIVRGLVDFHSSEF